MKVIIPLGDGKIVARVYGVNAHVASIGIEAGKGC